jgi:hypothetical protein
LGLLAWRWLSTRRRKRLDYSSETESEADYAVEPEIDGAPGLDIGEPPNDRLA